MASREQMIEKIARAVLSASWPDGDVSGFPSKRVAEMIAPVVLDAVLPQVSTVAELEALPFYAWLIGQVGHGGFASYQIVDGAHLDSDGRSLTFAQVLDLDQPLTVVWTPEVTA